jgi:Peptidase C13 family
MRRDKRCFSWESASLVLLLLVLGEWWPGQQSLSAAALHNNFAVLVDTSRYWFNYRHAVNAATIYRLLRQYGGFTNDRIVYMVADDYTTNPRTPLSLNVLHNANQNKQTPSVHAPDSLYDETTQIDYRQEDVTVANFVRILSGRDNVLHSDEQSHILVYLTGHGGNEFLKFRDEEELLASDLRRLVLDMKGRYKEILIIADTCQAFTLGKYLNDTENVMLIGSALEGESSYSHHSDPALGLSVIERYTFSVMEFLLSSIQTHETKRKKQAKLWSRNNTASWYPAGLSLKQALVDPYSYEKQRAHIGYTDEAMPRGRKLHQIPLTDFFVMNPDAPRPTNSASAVGPRVVRHFVPPTSLAPQTPEAVHSSVTNATCSTDSPPDGTCGSGLDQVNSTCQTRDSSSCSAATMVSSPSYNQPGVTPWEPTSQEFQMILLLVLVVVAMAARFW